LGVEAVRVLPGTSLAPETANTLSARLPDGPIVVVTFAERPADVEQARDDLHALIETFSTTLQPMESRRRVPVARSLHDELRVLSTRSMARDAIILDAQSPVIWGSANTLPAPMRNRWDDQLRELSGAVLTASGEEDLANASDPNFASQMLHDSPLGAAFAPDNSVMDLSAGAALTGKALGAARSTEAGADEDQSAVDLGASGETASTSMQLTQLAVDHLRARPELELASKGRPFLLRHRGEGLGYFAQSFAGIYVLALVFEGVFDELRAERAAAEALPRIEALVLALPPQGPDGGPTADIVSLRRR
jgi:hypothetical protein